MKYLKIESLPTDEQIKIVKLNRPETKNAFHPEMIAEITDTFQKYKNQTSLKSVVLIGEGTAFCAGADLNWMKEMVNYSFEKNIQDSEKLWDMFETIRQCDVPVIGIAHGAVYGGAIGLLACCDYVLAEEETRFCFSEVKLGLSPAVISSFILRKTTDALVRPYMISAEVFSSHTALHMGLVNRLIGEFETWQSEIKTFSGNGLVAMKETKKLLNKLSSGVPLVEQKKLTTKLISELRISPEGQERLKKFVQKK
jgi:methylglutaconyl-CoA hydratase